MWCDWCIYMYVDVTSTYMYINQSHHMSTTGTIYLCDIYHTCILYLFYQYFGLSLVYHGENKSARFVFGWLNDESKQVLIMESNINYIEDKCLAYPLQERISY